MKKFLKVVSITIVVIVIVSIVALLLFGRNNHSDLSGSVSEKIDQYLTNEKFQGTVLIAKEGEVLFTKGYGLAATDLPNSPSTLYQIASLSKTFTAVAVMQLAEKELLNLDDPISQYFPDFPNGETITISHLLSHSSGIPDYLKANFEFDYSKEWNPNDIVNTVSGTELEFAPGKSFSYSNTGYVMLGLIIEKVSGQPYGNYIEEHIFEPSNMFSSMFTVSADIPKAEGHVEGKIGPLMHNSAAYAAGDIISTVEDLELFYSALRNNVLISKETSELMSTTHAKKFPFEYGYGWYTQDIMGKKAVGHPGGYPSGFRHYVTRLNDEELTVIVLSNEMTVNSKRINRHLTSIVLQKPIWIWEEKL
ncbi:serine hydrolase domain-containing protein [Lysinibacillus pakistanensis]|uniref:Serine hydrolase n=1 Tax=Lysinibacillus pakistanensis TaxID=759811 RepID=A0ABX6DE86_9BACI|nr:serine hydrolase [Lysinibacillus pakistanensis]